MKYYIDIKEDNETDALLQYLNSLSIVNKIEHINDYENFIPEELKIEIRTRFEFSKQNPETRVDWSLAKQKLYERLQNISEQRR